MEVLLGDICTIQYPYIILLGLQKHCVICCVHCCVATNIHECPDAYTTHLSQVNCYEWELQRYSACNKLYDLDRKRLVHIPLYTVILRLPWLEELNQSLNAGWDPCAHVSLSLTP